jgi:hypothetical protein
MSHEIAPAPMVGEPPEEYIDRVITYLSEPDRRRLGIETSIFLRQAIEAMLAPQATVLNSALETAARQPIEEMVSLDELRDAHATAKDLLDRITTRLAQQGLWWIPD